MARSSRLSPRSRVDIDGNPNAGDLGTGPSLPSVHLSELYGADPSELMHIIHGMAVEDPQRLLIIAHNPGLHELALALIAGGDPAGRRALDANLPTSGVAVIDFATDEWDSVGFRSGRLERFASPKLLREDAGGD